MGGQLRDRILIAAMVTGIAVVAGSGVTVASARVPPSVQRSLHAVRYFKGSFRAGCGAQDCLATGGSIGTFHVPVASSPYAGVITLSFEYQSSATVEGGINVEIGCHDKADQKTDATAHPSTMRLAPSTHPTSTSVSFRVTRLEPGGTCLLQVSPVFFGSSKHPGTVGFDRFVATVQAWPVR